MAIFQRLKLLYLSKPGSSRGARAGDHKNAAGNLPRASGSEKKCQLGDIFRLTDSL
jgi:hypothetical protein